MTPYERFCARFHDYASTHPNQCVAKGIERHLDDLPDPSLHHARDQASAARGLLSELTSIGGAPPLTFDEALDLDLARLFLEAEEHNATYRFNGKTTLAQTPTAGSDIGNGIFLLFTNDPRPAADRLENIRNRLAQVPEYLEALLARLDTPVARFVQMDREKVEGLTSLFRALEGFAAEEGESDHQGLRRVTERAESALKNYLDRLSQMPTTDAVHVGGPVMERIIALRGIEVAPSELHRWAEDFLSETSASLAELAPKLALKHGLDPTISLDDLHAYLNRRYRLQVPAGDFSLVLQRYADELDRILAFVRARDLFPIPDNQRVVILKTPTFMEPSIPAGAMMSPPPFRAGVSTSLVYLTLSEALLDEHTELTIPSMMIHEGIPGHHLHLATASRHPSTIRKHFEAMDQAEGWTTMLEDYMLDAGYAAELSDEVRFCEKRDICRLGARVAIDLFLMSGDRDFLDVGVPCDLSSPDPFASAGSLLRAVTGFVPERVEAELNWYSQERGYPLSYLTGNRLVWQLKRDVAAHTSLDSLALDRTFHRAFLDAGSMPVAMLRRVFRHEGLLG